MNRLSSSDCVREIERHERIDCVRIECEKSSDMNVSIVVFRLSARD
jgi:hypothetical protein